MQFVLVLIPILVIVAVIYRLTSGPGPSRTGAGEASGSEQGGAAMAEVVADAADPRGGLMAPAPSSPKLRDVVLELLDRMGADEHAVDEAMHRLGFSPEVRAAAEEDTPGDVGPKLGVYRADDGLRDTLVRAILVGIQLARVDDDYAHVGDSGLAEEGVLERLEEAEDTLFGGGRRERYALCSRASIALQDMLEAERDECRLDVIRQLLKGIDDQVERLHEAMQSSMASVPTGSALQWGDSRDRRAYYVKVGVTDVLRRGGHLESLKHIYRTRGVNYDVAEAFQLAARECPALAALDLLGVDKLLGMGPADIHGIVHRSLGAGEPTTYD